MTESVFLTILTAIGFANAISLATDSIPLTETELVNPDRGYFTWHGERVVPLPRESFNTYNRYMWRRIAQQRGVFDFGPIDRDLDSAKAKGQKHGFRIMSVNDWEWNPAFAALGVPPYIKDESLGIHCPPRGAATDSIFVPDWNNAAFLKYLFSFVDTLGKRYNGDVRISYIDIGFYGHWGEWHLGDLCGPQATLGTKRAIIDAMIAAFPDTRLLMVPDEGPTNETRGEALSYAMQRSAHMGLRKDNLADGLAGGGSWFEQEIEGYSLVRNAIKNRWRTAPFVTEFIGYANDLSLAEGQVKKYHVSSIGNGNIYIDHQKKLKWESVATADRVYLIACGKAAGYRLLLDSVSISGNPKPGHAVALTSWWSNRGNAPVYDSWHIVWELRSLQGETLWKDTSGLDIRRVMPDSSRFFSDTCRLPYSLKAQSAILHVAVIDSSRYYPALQLAIRGRQSDGGYAIGAVHIDGTTSPVQQLPPHASATIRVRKCGTGLVIDKLKPADRVQLVLANGQCIAVGHGPSFSVSLVTSPGAYLLYLHTGNGSRALVLNAMR